MFCRCIEISDIKPIKNWNISLGADFEDIFAITHIYGFEFAKKWDN